MNYRLFLFIFLSLFLFNCEKSINNKSVNLNIKIENKYSNLGFAMIYKNDISDIKKLEKRSLSIYHKLLKKVHRV